MRSMTPHTRTMRTSAAPERLRPPPMRRFWAMRRIDSANERKPYLYVLGGDAASGYFETMPVHLTAGELPKDSSEIILPEHLAI